MMSNHTLSTARYIRLSLLLLGVAALTVLSVVVLKRTPQPPAAAPTTSAARWLENYGKVPLSFEANQGQTHEQVKFLTRQPGQSLFLTQTEAVLAISGKAQEKPVHATVRMKLVGANADAVVKGEAPLTGKTNYFIGNDPKQWRTDIATYEKVKYTGVYPDIDLVYYGNQQQLEYDFIVAPGADPKAIQLAFTGAQQRRLDEAGNLVLTTEAGEVVQHKPLIYQEVEGKRQEIAGNYLLQGENKVGFAVGEYDASLPLVIDPVLQYATFLGAAGVGGDSSGLAVDAAGNAYITGLTSINFPTTAGAYKSAPPEDPRGDLYIYVLKLNADGTAPLYSAVIGGSVGYKTPRYDGTGELYSLSNKSIGLAIDAAGNAYVAGQCITKNFPTTHETITPSFNVPDNNGFPTNYFLFKLSPNGDQLLSSTLLGSFNARALTVDAFGQVWIGGGTALYVPVTPDAYQSVKVDGYDAVVMKFSPDLKKILYSTYLGGEPDTPRGPTGDYVTNMAADPNGNVYATGMTFTANFPTTPNAVSHTGNVFAVKFNDEGKMLYSTRFGNSIYNVSGSLPSIAADALGYAYIAGSTTGAYFPVTPGAFRTTGGSDNQGITQVDTFLTKLTPDGSAFVYSTYFGGISSTDVALAVSADPQGNAYVAGYTWIELDNKTNDFATTTGTGVKFGSGMYVMKMNPAGNQLVYSTIFGGGKGGASRIVAGAAGNAYLAGAGQKGFPTTPGAYRDDSITDDRSRWPMVAKLAAVNTPEAPNPAASPAPTPLPKPSSYNVYGWVRDIYGDYFGGVVMDVTGSANFTTRIGGSLGRYSTFDPLLAGGDYTISVRLDGYVCIPPSYTLTNLNSTQTANFYLARTAPNTFYVHGTVNDANGQAVKGAVVSIDANTVVPTNVYGKYILEALAAKQKYTITVTKPGYTANPATLTINRLTANQEINFVLTPTGTPPPPVVNMKPLRNVSAANYAPSLARDAIVSAFGNGLAVTTMSATGSNSATGLGGTRVKVQDSQGIERVAPLFFVSPNQVNYQMPPGMPKGPARVRIISGDGTISSEDIQVEDTAPALFSADSSGRGVAAANVQRVKSDNSTLFEPVAQFDFTRGQMMPLPIELGAGTDTVYLVLYGTGIRYRRDLANVTATIGGSSVQVTYAGSQKTYLGLDQINVMIPRELAGRGEVDVVLNVEGKAANTVRVKIK